MFNRLKIDPKKTPLLYSTDDAPEGYRSKMVESCASSVGTYTGEAWVKPGTLFKKAECVPHGHGTVKLASGDTFEGDFKAGACVSSQGVVRMPEGHCYTGAVKTTVERKGLSVVKQGPGVFTYVPPPSEPHAAVLFEGTFEDNFLTQGRVRYGDGYTYEGALLEGEPHDPKGRMHLPDGSVIEAVFKKGTLFPTGTRTFLGGLTYTGTLGSGGNMDGLGTLVFHRTSSDTHRCTYNGQFENNTCKGPGILQINEDGLVFTGTFQTKFFNGSRMVLECTGKQTTGTMEFEGSFTIDLNWTTSLLYRVEHPSAKS